MNYLAHIFLARQSADAMVGALLGDFCRPNEDGRYGGEMAREITIHRKVDAFTDRHAITLQARTLFRSQTRRYAGISLDVFYDHILANSWERYCELPLEPFTQQFYQALLGRRTMLPPALEQRVHKMVAQDWLGSYRDFESVRIAVNRISERLSRNGLLLKESVGDLEAHYEVLAEGFHAFFPELIRFAEQERETININRRFAAGTGSGMANLDKTTLY